MRTTELKRAATKELATADELGALMLTAMTDFAVTQRRYCSPTLKTACAAPSQPAPPDPAHLHSP